MTYYVHQIPEAVKFTLPWNVSGLSNETVVIELPTEGTWQLAQYLIDKVQNRSGYLILPPLIDLKRLFLELTLNHSKDVDTEVVIQLENFIKLIEPFYSEDSLLLLQL